MQKRNFERSPTDEPTKCIKYSTIHVLFYLCFNNIKILTLENLCLTDRWSTFTPSPFFKGDDVKVFFIRINYLQFKYVMLHETNDD